VLDLATFTRAMIACGYGKRDALDDVYGPGALYAPGAPLVAAKDSEVPSLTLMHAKRERAFQVPPRPPHAPIPLRHARACGAGHARCS
jgi:hypothetical protein